MTPLLSSLEGMTSMYMASQAGPHTAQSIRDIIAQLRETPMFAGKIEDEDAEELARLIEEKYGISMGLGAIVDAEDFKPWLHDARINGEVGDFYWGRYRKLLGLKGLPKSVIDGTDEVTDKVLDRLGNPNNLSPWSRRGMVVGHVQSGKTANYTGLICKAADAGYRLIVVIAGIHNNLRNQTQARIDEGFIGRDTGRLAHANKAQRQKIIGVGQFDQREFPVSLTNTLRDFNKATATTFTAQLSQINVPVVLVIKKNSSTLKNLLEWLKEHSVHQSTQMVSQPMLLIDDEADNASINTAYQRDEVTRINSQIRELLSLFHRSCYVGYTATPFANIFIDPDTDDEALKQDLFPRDFIIGLDAPSNYFGAQKIFLDARDQHIRLIDDNEDVLPMKHKIDHPVDVLPGSLIEAVRAFIVARAIRNARGQQAGHASMLVNASRFTDVQGRLRSRIADVVARIRDVVAVEAGKGSAALRNPEIAALHATWKREFADAEGGDWPSVQARLHEV
ncbi:Z1 domain-containing protein, partial [Marivita sp.]|uniref:Z1 domain-containing protein n=1 Tax=Marivita sp. TaxID=2003365 RepID=UPI003A85EC8C